MKNTVKTKWVKALKTGLLSDGRKIKQGQHTLRSNGKFCCLGVLCEEAVIAGVIPPAKRRTKSGVKGWFYGPGEDDVSILPEAVVEWAGLLGRNPNVARYREGRNYSLSWLNDHSGADFEEIADLIKDQL